MTITLDEVLARLPEARRKKVEANAARMIAEEMDLREVRRLRRLTQSRLSKKLKIGQEGVSRIEKRSDLYLSTLRSYVEGVGGELTLMVRFPDRAPVILKGLGENEEAPNLSQKRSAKMTKKRVQATATKNKKRSIA